MVRTIAVIAIAVGAGFFALALALGTDPRDGFVFAIGVTVALVPEGLLPTVTLSLAVGAQRMAGRQALVRRLEAVETLGSTTFICLDKTGTLTRNEMAVVEVWTPAGAAHVEGRGYEPTGVVDVDASTRPALEALALAAVRCSSGRSVQREGRWVAQGDPMEAALDTLARRLTVDVPAHAHAEPELRRFTFDPRRRRMSIVADGGGAREGGTRRGAPAAAPTCPECMTRSTRSTERGLRVLAVAARALAAGEPVPQDASTAERDLRLLGLVALQDPPREGAAAALQAVRRAGVRVAMVTGDHPSTAAAIGAQVGLSRAGGTVIVGADLPADDTALGELVDNDGAIVARVSPEDKLRVARALRARSHVVAMTGDGVNDGPALHEADIGIAMGRSGTDVAREAADLVLLDDDVVTIVAAIEHGRATFSNIRRFLTYHLTDNVAELTPFVIWALSGGASRSPSACFRCSRSTSAPTSCPRRRSAPSRPAGGHWTALRRAAICSTARCCAGPSGGSGPTEAAVEMAAFFATFWAAGWRPGDAFPEGGLLAAASGAAFTAVVIGQAANAFACRSASRPVWQVGGRGNRTARRCRGGDADRSGAVPLPGATGGSARAGAPFSRRLRRGAPRSAGGTAGRRPRQAGAPSHGRRGRSHGAGPTLSHLLRKLRRPSRRSPGRQQGRRHRR